MEALIGGAVGAAAFSATAYQAREVLHIWVHITVGTKLIYPVDADVIMHRTWTYKAFQTDEEPSRRRSLGIRSTS